MRIRFHWPSALLGATAAGMLCMLGLFQPTATAQSDKQPFANAVEQRQETIQLLRDGNALLKEQLELLRSGKLHVIAEPAKE
jgi:hypothetical protein